MAGFGVVERRFGVVERRFGVVERGVAERIRGTADPTLEGKIGEMGNVSCAANLLDPYRIEVKDV